MASLSAMATHAAADPTAQQMAANFAGMFCLLFSAWFSARAGCDGGRAAGDGRWLPSAVEHLAKRAVELWFLCYELV